MSLTTTEFIMLRECIDCGIKFNPRSPAKLRAGGKINTCVDCSDEPAVKYLGLASGDGKQPSITVLKFNDKSDREAYREMWYVNSGMMVGKACQMGLRKSDPGVRFKTVTQSLATNHKGKLT